MFQFSVLNDLGPKGFVIPTERGRSDEESHKVTPLLFQALT